MYVCVHMCSCAHTTAHVTEDNLENLVLSLNYMHVGGGTQVFRLRDKNFYPGAFCQPMDKASKYKV